MSWRVEPQGLGADGAPVWILAPTQPLPVRFTQGDHIIGKAGSQQGVGQRLGVALVVSDGQQIHIREAVPVAPCPGAKQPDAGAWVMSQQRRHPQPKLPQARAALLITDRGQGWHGWSLSANRQRALAIAFTQDLSAWPAAAG